MQANAPEPRPENVLAFLEKYGKAAPVEIATVFDLSSRTCETMVAGLAAARLIPHEPTGNGSFWLPVTDTPSCDAKAITCAAHG